MKVFFLEKIEKNSLLLITVAFMSSIGVLALSLSVMSAIMTFAMGCAIIIFDKSFSRGWLFVLSVLLLFPQIKIGAGTILLNDIILLMLALIGLTKLAVSSDYRMRDNILGKYFLSFSAFGLLLIAAKKIFGNQEPDGDLLLLSITSFLFLVILEAFKYYFQTQKRIERFFKVIFVIAAIHSFFGIIMMAGGWQTNSGMGISTITSQVLMFEDAKFQINGFFGVGLFGRTRTNILTPFLLLTIPIGVGFLKKMSSEKQAKKTDTGENKTSDTYVRWTVDYVRNITKAEGFVLLLLAIQIIALILTFSYLSLIFAAFSMLVMGILDRKKGLAIVSGLAIFVLSAIVPSLKKQADVSTFDIPGNLANFVEYSRSWLLGSGFSDGMLRANSADAISNSYFFIWKTCGIIGLIIVLSMLYRYLKELFWSYKTSDGTKRIWLISLIGAATAFVPEAAAGNVLFFGPSALVFWLFYAACHNLRKKEIIFGITESRINT